MNQALLCQVVLNLLYVVLWIALSGTVVVFNKWLLSFGGFPFPISLTLWHMGFSSILSFGLVRGGLVESNKMSFGTYFRAVVPIGALFAGTLWLSNAAYLILSVSFVQMLKALMPVSVFGVGCFFGTESFSFRTLANMVVITIGVAIASYGELDFVWMGVIYALLSVASESTRLTLVQILLQSKGHKLNPLTTLYYVAPASFLFLSIPWVILEAKEVLYNPSVVINVPIFIANAAVAFALNMAVFLLINKTSALTMNVAGVIKDWMLIALSILLFNSAVSTLNLGGYGLAFVGVGTYNFTKYKALAERQKQMSATVEEGKVATLPAERTPLLGADLQQNPVATK